MHGGRIWATGSENNGLTILISLDRRRDEGDEQKILIVEDDMNILQLEKDYLEANGFEVETTTDGARGLELALNGNYNLIMLDIMLPSVDGMEICKRVRRVKNIPILLVSAKRDDLDKIKGLGVGADDYIVKPFSPSELVARVIAHINRYERLTSTQQDNGDIIEIDNIKIDKNLAVYLSTALK